MILTGDCLEVMAGMPAESVDAVVTDPPAAVSFMGKKWDHDRGGRTEWVAWMTEVMRECYRLLKPGGYAVVWSLPRTCHWTAWAMEDAGFIIRDQLAHVFASGFPKGKAQLKPAREDWWLARKPGPLRPLAIDACRIGLPEDKRAAGSRSYQRAEPGGRGQAEYQDAPHDGLGRWPSNVLLSDPALFDEPNPEVVGSGAVSQATPPGTRRPGPRFNGGTYANGEVGGEQTEYGYGDTGGYSRFFRVPTPGPDMRQLREGAGVDGDSGDETAYPKDAGVTGVVGASERADSNSDREPASYPKAFIIPKADRADREPVLRGQSPEQDDDVDGTFGLDAARPHTKPDYRYERKARVNVHPTTKPTDLMRHLIRLVTPIGGTILDPFLGSGTTGIAAELEGFQWIGIEKEAEYVAIAEARLNGVQRGLGLDVPAPTSSYRPPTKMPKARWGKDEKAGPDSWFHDPEEAA